MLKLVIAITSVLALAVGCAGDGDGEGAEIGGPPGSDPDDDHGCDDCGECDDCGDDVLSLCPEFSGLIDGTRTVLEGTPAHQAQTETAYRMEQNVVAVEKSGGSVEVTVEFTTLSTGDGFTSTTSGRSLIHCDDAGAHMLGSSMQSVTTTAHGTNEVTSETTYEPPLTTMIWQPSMGDSWSTATAVSTESVINGESYPTESVLEYEYSVVGVDELIEVPAGEFEDTVRLLLNTSTSSQETEHARDLGFIRSATTHLTDF